MSDSDSSGDNDSYDDSFNADSYDDNASDDNGYDDDDDFSHDVDAPDEGDYQAEKTKPSLPLLIGCGLIAVIVVVLLFWAGRGL